MQGKIDTGKLMAAVALRVCAASQPIGLNLECLVRDYVLIFRGANRGLGTREGDKWGYDYTITRIARVE